MELEIKEEEPGDEFGAYCNEDATCDRGWKGKSDLQHQNFVSQGIVVLKVSYFYY